MKGEEFYGTYPNITLVIVEHINVEYLNAKLKHELVLKKQNEDEFLL